jgi:hypothetical protein
MRSKRVDGVSPKIAPTTQMSGVMMGPTLRKTVSYPARSMASAP